MRPKIENRVVWVLDLFERMEQRDRVRDGQYSGRGTAGTSQLSGMGAVSIN